MTREKMGDFSNMGNSSANFWRLNQFLNGGVQQWKWGRKTKKKRHSTH
jgi:hypothetical protein